MKPLGLKSNAAKIRKSREFCLCFAAFSYFWRLIGDAIFCIFFLGFFVAANRLLDLTNTVRCGVFKGLIDSCIQ